MKDVILTGWSGSAFAEIAAHTIPVMKRYAERHGLGFACTNLTWQEIPPSWLKIPNLIAALSAADRVLWIDADVVVAESSANIFDDLEEGRDHALVLHETECGKVPNCGVWIVTKAMIPVLEEVWREGFQVYRDHPWWEQAAVMERLGFVPHVTDGWPHSEDVGDTPLRQRTQWLNQGWNDHPRDEHRDLDPRFVHVTQYADRLGVVRRLCAAAT